MKRKVVKPIIIPFVIAAVVAFYAQADKVTIDARSGATQIDYNNPYFFSNQTDVFDPSANQDSPNFTTSAKKDAEIANGTIKTYFIKNLGNENGGTMDRVCTLRGKLSGENSEYLAIDVWANGKPLTGSSDQSLQPSSAEPFVYIKTSNTSREIRYKLSNQQQIDLAIGCRADIEGMYTTQLKCIGEQGGAQVVTYSDSRIWCKVNKKEDKVPITQVGSFFYDSFEN